MARPAIVSTDVYAVAVELDGKLPNDMSTIYLDDILAHPKIAAKQYKRSQVFWAMGQLARADKIIEISEGVYRVPKPLVYPSDECPMPQGWDRLRFKLSTEGAYFLQVDHMLCARSTSC